MMVTMERSDTPGVEWPCNVLPGNVLICGACGTEFPGPQGIRVPGPCPGCGATVKRMELDAGLFQVAGYRT